MITAYDALYDEVMQMDKMNQVLKLAVRDGWTVFQLENYLKVQNKELTIVDKIEVSG